MVGTFQPVILVFGGVAFISRPCLFLDLFHQIFWTCPSFIRSWISKKRRHGCHWNHPLKNWVANFWNLKHEKKRDGRWQQKPQFSLLPLHLSGCSWCQCKTWVWLVWWRSSGHQHWMESSAFVSFSCWTLTAMVSAALQAGGSEVSPLKRPDLAICLWPFRDD